MSKLLATFTPDEERAWGDSFAWYRSNGWVDDEAAELAWIDLQSVFPRLKDFDGAESADWTKSPGVISPGGTK